MDTVTQRYHLRATVCASIGEAM